MYNTLAEDNDLLNRRVGELEALNDEHQSLAALQEMAIAKLKAERDRLREMGNWLAAEARENWEQGRVSVDLLTAVEAWERTALQEGK